MCADGGVSERPAAYPSLAICGPAGKTSGHTMPGRLRVLASFRCVVSLSSSARLCTCLLPPRSVAGEGLLVFLAGKPRGAVALYVPNAMFVFVFEGALFALTYNGDRFVLFALLPRRKPRTVQYSHLIVPLFLRVFRKIQ